MSTAEDKQLFEICEKRIDLIKVMTVCAIVMEVTRRLSV